eukprot:TRINITY_DN6300_c0_g3_i1.p1 TRINITY_DN6300_c0_g3~~TRINITY_DN6300_c0_g3_i1.p1  ORF type:complete len:123 (-),score=36.29 TRINITY_DN6300_c0_g3_i1:85-453(-)
MAAAKTILLEALCNAIEAGNKKEYEERLNNNPELLNCGKPGKNGGNWTPLHCACFTKNVAAVRFLLNLGANIDARNSSDNTPIVMATHSKNVRDETNALEIVKLLVAADKDKDGIPTQKNSL